MRVEGIYGQESATHEFIGMKLGMRTTVSGCETDSRGGMKLAAPWTLASNPGIGQDLRKIFHAGIGHLSVADVYPLEAGHTAQVFKTRIGHVDSVQIQVLHLR